MASPFCLSHSASETKMKEPPDMITHSSAVSRSARSIVLTFGIFIAVFAARPHTASALPGDVNADGILSAADAGLLRAHILGRASLSPSLLPIADANQDGVLDTADVGWIHAGLHVLSISLPGGVALELMRIPAGTFLMGSPREEQDRWDDEGPQTEVTIARDFFLGKFEVTQAQWRAVMGNNPSYLAGDDYPVESVSWNDARDFAAALNAHVSATGQGPALLRLPTEAEWEYACRADTTTRFFFGDAPDCRDDCTDCAAGFLPGAQSEYMWYCGNNDPFGVKSVGGKLPNAFGLYDMHGNVWEWCQDWYGPHPGGSVTNPTGPATGSYRVVRGGSCYSLPSYCRSAFRDGEDSPDIRYIDLGFRVVLVVPYN
jgi:formylglycine-generating enzyme required for sulfatase activity